MMNPVIRHGCYMASLEVWARPDAIQIAVVTSAPLKTVALMVCNRCACVAVSATAPTAARVTLLGNAMPEHSRSPETDRSSSGVRDLTLS